MGKWLSYIILQWFLMSFIFNPSHLHSTPSLSLEQNERSSPAIIIIRGPPASGKTAVSLVLKDKLSPSARISIDVLRYLVTPRNFSHQLLKAIKLNAARLAVAYAEQGISSIIESVFASQEIVEEMCTIVRSYGFSPKVFTLVADEETIVRQNLDRELYYQTDQERVRYLYQNYVWDIGQKIRIEGKEIEEVAADICMNLERSSQLENVESQKEGDRYLIFLRHGEAPNDPNIFISDEEKDLSLLGKTQADNIAPILTLLNPDVIYASPFLRAATTAKLACKGLSKEILWKEGLKERSFPVLYGKTREEIAASYGPEIVSTLERGSDSVEIKGCESLLDAQKRVLDEVASILNHPGQRILIVSHGGPHSWLCCYYLGLDLSHTRKFTLDEGRLSVFQFDSNGVFKRIVSLNSINLPPLGPMRTIPQNNAISLQNLSCGEVLIKKFIPE